MHAHPCINWGHGCRIPAVCGGNYAPNHDGFPDVVCESYHLPNGSTDPQLCGVCEAAQCWSCEAVLLWEEHLETCSEHPLADMRSW